MDQRLSHMESIPADLIIAAMQEFECSPVHPGIRECDAAARRARAEEALPLDLHKTDTGYLQR